MKEIVRLDKYLADMGIGTRSEVKNFIRKGRVRVNDEPVKQPERKITLGTDKVECDGQLIAYVSYEYYMLNKPAGVISASSDPKAETVIDLIVDANRKDLFPVGRLDKDTEGLLLLTNDGDLAHRLLSPKKHVDKTYYAFVLGKVTSEDEMKFEQGLVVDEELTAMPAKLKIIGYQEKTMEDVRADYSDRMEELIEEGYLTGEESGSVPFTEITLTIREGKFHQVKRMFEAVGKKVVYLKRLTMGCLTLDESLGLGEYRELTEAEKKELGI